MSWSEGEMHHKRGKPKNSRAGCLMCKPHKANHAAKAGGDMGRETVQAWRTLQEPIELPDPDEDVIGYWCDNFCHCCDWCGERQCEFDETNWTDGAIGTPVLPRTCND